MTCGAVPGRRYSEFTDVLQAIQTRDSTAQRKISAEARWSGLRLVVASPCAAGGGAIAITRRAHWRPSGMAQQWAGKLDGQKTGAKARGRKLSDDGTKERL